LGGINQLSPSPLDEVRNAMDKTNADEVTQYELETWKRCAEDYLDTFAGLTSQSTPILIEAAEIRPGSHVLDLGSGPGHVAKMLAQAEAVVTGVDFSPQMVKTAQSHYPHIKFREANAEELPFDDGAFDAVVSNYVVHHLARPEVVFREISRVLKPGGRFAFVVWGAPEEQSSVGAFFGAVEAHHEIAELPHGPLFGVTELSVYEPLLSQAGLEDCQLTTHGVTWITESLDPVLKGFWDWGNMAALPSEIQEKIRETTRENAQPYKQNGRFELPHTALLGTALKP
jgi:ubiquinone/menaquinone biosynthesis C-methylase UbiE